MRLLVDAHLPRSLCTMLEIHGYDAVHTLDLPAQNATKDGALNGLSVAERRIVVSKDRDFFYSHLLQRRPWKLLLVRTGNISTRDLRELFERNLEVIEEAFLSYTLVEVDRVAVLPVL